mgnify:CR=1 FL=1
MNKNWRQEYKRLRVLTPLQERVLEKGATSLATAHILNALHQDYDRLKGIQDPPTQDLQSSFKEWNENYEQANRTIGSDFPNSH